MKLRAMISLEVDAEDFTAAAGHEQAIRAVFRRLKAQYDSATLEFREASTRHAPSRNPGHIAKSRPTGKLHQYID